MLRRDVKGNGPSDGLVIVGEAPGETEVKQGIPFVGASGQVLRRKLQENGIDPLRVRFENVIERKLENNNVLPLYKDKQKYVATEELSAWRADLKTRLEALRPKAILALGDTALRALTYETSIMKCQSYVLRDTKVPHPVVPGFHPAFILRQPEHGIWLSIAIQKAALVAQGAQDQERNVIISPSFHQTLNFLNAANHAAEVAVDIEKRIKEPQELTAIAVALSPTKAISIPFVKSFGESYWKPEQEQQIWKALAKLLGNEKVGKIFHNYIFDTMALAYYGLPTKGPITDTMVLSNLLTPELRKKLGDVARLYSMCEPWKGQKDWDLSGYVKSDFWLYNARDALYTFEIVESQREGLEKEGLTEYYRHYIEPLYPLLLEVCCRGWRIDERARNELSRELSSRLSPLLERLVSSARSFLGPGKKAKKRRDPEKDIKTDSGEIKEKAYKTIYEEIPREFNPASPPQVKEVLTNMGVSLPTRQGKETTDERALLKVNRKYALPIIPQILEYRGLQKLKSTYCEAKTDPDGRMRYSLNLAGTKSGRLSSNQTPFATGCNSQNLPKEFRHVVIPDEGKTLVQVDLSQAELRMVAWLAAEDKLIEMLDNNEDVHTFAANRVTDIVGEAATRQLGKQINHASNYGIGPDKFADLCLMKCGIAITVEQAQKILKARNEFFPKIKRWQDYVTKQVAQTRFLKTPLGRIRTFYGRLDDELFREALSFVPQSTVVDVINRAWYELSMTEPFKKRRSLFYGQCHDSLLFEVENVEETRKVIDEVFSKQKFEIHDRICVIPWDVSVGPNWKDVKDVK